MEVFLPRSIPSHAFSVFFYCCLNAAEEKRSALFERSEFADRPERILAAVKPLSVAWEVILPGRNTGAHINKASPST
jgi:hypothetical protein